MHLEDIKAGLRKRFGTVQAFEKHAGLVRGAVANALRQPNRKAETAIAQALGVSPAALWPERYDSKTGKRHHPQPRLNYAARFMPVANHG